jgi:hypothetical protein
MYEMNEAYAAINIRPAAPVLLVWALCVVSLTPLIALISAVVLLSLFILILWITLIVIACVAARAGSSNMVYETTYETNA